MPSPKFRDIDDFIGYQDPEIQVKFYEARDLINNSSLKIRECIKYNTAFFMYSTWLCYLSIEKKQPLLCFTRGNLMSDSENVFEGLELKLIRKINLNIVNQEVVEQYLQEAMMINEQIKKRKNG